MPPRDAWVIRRLMTGIDPNGELRTLSDALRPFADRLAGMTLEDRSAALQGYLAGQT